MKSSKILASVALLAAMALACTPAGAQMRASASIAVGHNSGTTSAKASWLKAEVIHADLHSITVREQSNDLMVHTFTYSQQLQPQIEKVMDAGGYQYGDAVSILWVPGKTVALKIHGKPSKAL
jgi:hypothetical protein